MKLKVMSVEMNDTGTRDDMMFKVQKVTQQQPEAPGEKVDPTRQKTTIYEGPDRQAALAAKHAAEREMFAA